MYKSDLIFNENLIKKRIFPFESPKRMSIKDEFFKSSAVLFAIIPYKEKPYDLILIHRTNRGSKHAGEMSFPGGSFDSNHDTSLKDTALRETEEEIGVPREKIKILGCLDDFPTMTRFIISPFIGIIDKDQILVKEEREVQEILKIPFDFFISKKNFREQAIDIEGKKFPIFYFNFKNKENRKTYTVWGATAYMISNFIEIVYDIDLSELGLKRFKLENIKQLKDYIKYRRKITSKF